MSNKFAAIVGDKTATFVIDGTVYNLNSDHPRFDKVIEHYRNGEFDQIPELVDLERAVRQFVEGKLLVENGVVTYDGHDLPDAFVKRILEMIKDGFDVSPLVKFLDNLYQNPSKRAVDELYGFLECNQLPITTDGKFMAYKRVKSDFTDCYTGTMDNSVGQTVKMERNRVDDDKTRTCSHGLHFCSLNYLQDSGYGGSNNPIVLVEVDPKDVVSIPTDYNNSKGRCSQYTVTAVHYEGENTEAFDTSVVDNTPDVDDHDDVEEFESNGDVLVVGQVYTKVRLAELLGTNPDAIRKRATRGVSVVQVSNDGYEWKGE